jgi:hypothetical protein
VCLRIIYHYYGLISFVLYGGAGRTDSYCNENHRAMITLHCVPHNIKKITQFISPRVLLLKKKLFIIAHCIRGPYKCYAIRIIAGTRILELYYFSVHARLIHFVYMYWCSRSLDLIAVGELFLPWRPRRVLILEKCSDWSDKAANWSRYGVIYGFIEKLALMNGMV